jgi:hypothetical protein
LERRLARPPPGLSGPPPHHPGSPGLAFAESLLWPSPCLCCTGPPRDPLDGPHSDGSTLVRDHLVLS